MEVRIPCEEIGQQYSSFMVKTPHNEIKEAIETARNETISEQMRIFQSISNEVTKYDEQTLKHYWFNGKPQFQDWCDDVVLYYVYRLVLFNEAIPLSV